MKRCTFRQRGVTLVELMIGVVIGLFLVAAMGGIYVGSQSTFRAQNELARMQQNGRFALDTIAQDLRILGALGCQGRLASQTSPEQQLAPPPPRAVTALSPITPLNDFLQQAWGSHNAGTWAPALPAALTAAMTPAPDPAGDVLLIRRPVGPAWAVITGPLNNATTLQVSPGAPYGAGDILMVSDCEHAQVFAATAVDATTGTITHPVFSTAFAPGATVQRLQTVLYYLAPAANGQRALWTLAVPAYGAAAVPVQLVSGVDGLAVNFGLDTSVPPDGAVDRYLDASGVNGLNGWGIVASARLSLLLSSKSDNVTTAPQPYQFNSAVATVPADRRLRTVMTTTASVRNYLP